MDCRIAAFFVFFVTSVPPCVRSQQQIELLESGQTFTVTAQFSVGYASDLLVDFQCIGTDLVTSWSRRTPRFSELPQPLDPRSTSFSSSSGVARIFSDYIRNNIFDAGAVTLQCLRDGPGFGSVTLVPVQNLFFTAPFLTPIASTADLRSFCTGLLPQLPTFTVTPVTTLGSHGYCDYQSARGSFRSPSFTFTDGDTGTSPAPEFVIQPLNITVQSINNVTRGAFSCGVYPSSPVQSIAWYFDPGSGASPVSSTSDPDVRTLSQTGGTSVLVLENVGPERVGSYHCQVTLDAGENPLVSGEGFLVVNETAASDVDTIILAPPPSLSVSKGNSVLIPCVGSTQQPVFTGGSPAATRGTPSSFGLTISSADREDRGTIVCQVGGASAEVNLTVYAEPRFEEELKQEVARFLNEDKSPIQLTCELSGVPLPSLTFLYNNQPLSNTSRLRVNTESPTCNTCVRHTLSIEDPQPGDEGVYQCLGTAGEDSSTTIVSTSYLNLQFLMSPVVSYNGEVVEEEVELAIEDFGKVVQLECSVAAHPIPSISWSRNDSSPLTDTQTFTGFREPAMSVLELAVDSVVGSVAVTCSAGLMGVVEATTITVTVPFRPPVITGPPDDVIAIENELVNFTCVVSGLPQPVITWTPDPFTVILGPTSSTLQFEAALSLNLTSVHCTAVNSVGSDTSTNATLTIAGGPGTPSLSATPGARDVTIEWISPFSLLPISQLLQVIAGPSDSIQRTPPPSPFNTLNSVTIDSLRPFTSYTVTLTTTNRAGDSVATLSFTTDQAAPDSSPINVVAAAVDTDSILVSWEPPPMSTRNGIITQYVLTFGPIATPTLSQTSTETQALVPIEYPDTAYSFTVAAETVFLGPASPPVVQRSYPLPPPPPETPPTIPDDVAITVTTIPINLPTMNTSLFSHFWVVAVRLGSSDAIPGFLLSSPSEHFTSSQSLTTYSDDIPENSGYIVSEISAAVYDVVSSKVFILGDQNETKASNDFPERYLNGPLEEGTRYSVFVWGFIPAILNSSEGVAKRQTQEDRQYTVFTSSSFSRPTSTATRVPTTGGGGLSAAAIAGIVIAVLIAFVLVPLVVVMAFIIANMWYRRVKDIGPPPIRQGSKRFKEEKSVVTVMLNPNTRRDSALDGDTTPDDVRLPVSVENFPEHVRKLHVNSDHPFSEEYQLINIKSPGLPHLQGSANCNVMKNRYANINAYDETRVHLNFIPGVEGSDFINANYIEGYQKKTLYIAAQGPLPNTVHDFWRMVWEEDSCCIVMLTNINEKGRVKCHQYWPETGSLGLDDMTVTVIDTQDLAYYSIRTFRLSMGTERREVKQFHYTGWPDFGVPDHPHPVLSFIRRLNNFKRTTPGPDIAHCSAGVGRTGTLITIQAMMKVIEDEGKVDIFNFILAMRRQRSYMVQTERQYIFIHDAVLEVIQMGDTEVSSQSLRRTLKQLQAQDPQTETSRLEEEYLRLNSLVAVGDSVFSYANNSLNQPKNRDPKILPLDMYRVRLIMAPGFSCSDYINASYVDGYQHRHQYILTQGPLQPTVDDFWRMMWEHNVSCVFMLCQTEEKGQEMCVQYWSKEGLKQHGDLFVELTQETNFTHYTMRELSLTNTKVNESRVLRHYQYVEWTEDAVPPNSTAVIDLIGVLQKAQHQNGGGPIVLHDSTPIGRAGTFCVLSSVLEQLKVEGVVDIFFFVHALRQQQPGLVATFEQYKFCYSSVLEFLVSFELYSNFD